MIELYHWEPNAESLALLICLKEKDIAFRSHYVDMLQLEHHEPAYLELSPKARVPLLLAEGEAMSDAGFAMQYLAERYPEPRLAPDDAAGWYDAQAWTAWLGPDMGLAADVRLLGWNHVMLDTLPADELEAFRAKVAELPQEKISGWAAVWRDAETDEDRLASAEERVQQVISKMETAIANHAWIVGRTYSIVDVMAYAQVHALPQMLSAIVSEEATPNIIDWLERISLRPAVTDALAMRRSTIAPAPYLAPGC
jgi:glutathione S-transferase/GST-like protein